MEYKRQKWLVYNRVGVGRIRNTLKYIDKTTLINNIICISNGIFHGICRVLRLETSENIDTMRGKLSLAWYQGT